MTRFSSMVAFCLLLAHTCGHATVTLERGETVLHIIGTIQKGDADRVISLLNGRTPNGLNVGLFVELNSKGGDVDEAMRIGERLRAANAEMYVQKDTVCISSCVLILAAGLARTVNGRVGIHRPYLPMDAATSMQEQKQIHTRIESVIKRYLETMNISKALYDDMFRVPPEKVKFLSESELQSYGLNEADPYWSEALDTKVAASQGISKGEWIFIKANCLQKGLLPGSPQCKEIIARGKK